MSERPREGTQERYIDQWPKPMFLCTHCDEQTDSDPCQECAFVFDERGENYPPVLRFQVVPAPAQPEQPTRGGDELAARLEEKARAESDEFGNYHDRYAEGPALPEPPRIESAPARVETEDIERLRDVVDRFDDGVGMNYLYVESLGRILDSFLGDLTYKDLAEVDEIVIERGKTSGPEAFSWATPPKGGFDPRHDASRGPDRPASPSQPIEQANCPESTQKNLPAAPPDPQPSEARVDLEQSERVDLEWAFRLMRDCLQTGKKPEDYEQDRLDDIADAMIRPTPTEQGEARVEGRWICDGCGAKVLPAQIHDCPNTPPGRASSSTFRPAQTEQGGEGEAS